MHTHTHPPTPHLSPEVCMVVLSLCPSRAPPAAVVWPHPSTLEEVNHSSPSLSPLWANYTDHIHMFKKNLALVNIYTVHQLTIVLSVCEHCGRSVQKFRWFGGLVCVQWPPYQERDRMSVTDTKVMRVERAEKGGLGMRVCLYLLTAPTELHCRPYHLRAHTVTEKNDSANFSLPMFCTVGLEEGEERPLSYLWVFREPHWGNLHNEIQVFIHMICSCQDTPTLPAPCCVPQWNCSHSDCSLHPISEVKQAHKNHILHMHSETDSRSSFKAFTILFLYS